MDVQRLILFSVHDDYRLRNQVDTDLRQHPGGSHVEVVQCPTPRILDLGYGISRDLPRQRQCALIQLPDSMGSRSSSYLLIGALIAHGIPVVIASSNPLPKVIHSMPRWDMSPLGRQVDRFGAVSSAIVQMMETKNLPSAFVEQSDFSRVFDQTIGRANTLAFESLEARGGFIHGEHFGSPPTGESERQVIEELRAVLRQNESQTLEGDGPLDAEAPDLVAWIKELSSPLENPVAFEVVLRGSKKLATRLQRSSGAPILVIVEINGTAISSWRTETGTILRVPHRQLLHLIETVGPSTSLRMLFGREHA